MCLPPERAEGPRAAFPGSSARRRDSARPESAAQLGNAEAVWSLPTWSRDPRAGPPASAPISSPALTSEYDLVFVLLFGLGRE